METSNPPQRRIGLTLWLIASQVLALATLSMWIVVAALSVMAFDSGTSTGAWIFVIAVWSYPILPLGLAIGAWIAFARRRNTLAAILSGLTFTPMALLWLVMWLPGALRQLR